MALRTSRNLHGRLQRLLNAGEAGEARTASTRQIAGNIAQQYASRFLGLAVGLVTLPLVARTLGAEGFGIYGAALAYVGLFSSLTEFGLTQAAMMRMAGDPARETQWLGALASLRALASLAVASVCAVVIPLVFSGGESRWAALVLTSTIFFVGAGALMSVFQSRLRGAIPLAVSVLQNVLWLVTVVVLVVLDAGPIGVAFGYAGMLGVIALVQVRVTRRIAVIAWRGARERWASLVRVAIPLGLASVFITAYNNLDTILLLELSGAEEAGYYAAAARFMGPLLFLPQAVMGAFFPVMSAIKGSDDARLRRIVQRCAEYMAISTLPVAAVALVLSAPLVGVAFGEDFDEAADVLPILMIAYVSIGYGTLAGFLAPVLGLQWRLTAYSGVGAIANIALNVALIPSYGAVGAAIATVVTEVTTMTLLFSTCLRRLNLRLRWQPIIATSAGAGAMGGAMLAIRPLGLLPALATGAMVYAAVLLALRVVDLAELRTLKRS